MADYYSVLARAIVNLDTQDAGVRQELYERARNIIVPNCAGKIRKFRP